jgi:hypothetical protein
VDLNKLSLGDKLAGGAGILLVIGLLFLPWHKIDFGGFEVGGVDVEGESVTRTAIQSPNSFWGILALLLTILIVAVVILRKLTTVELPALGSGTVSWSDVTFFATIAVGVLLLLKLVVETDALGWGMWLDLIFAGVMIYGGFLIKQEGDVVAPGTPGTPGQPPQTF